MSEPVISVIIPVYNVEPYLRRCLDSVTGQTYAALEILLVDDGSTDGSGGICDEYAAKDVRVKVIHKKNGGAALARNAGLETASGGWIGFVDSDDYIESDPYEYLLDLAERTGADIAQCGAVEETGGRRKIRYTPAQECQIDADHITDAAPFFANANWCRIYRRELLDGILFEEAYMIGEDLLLNLRALERANHTAFGTEAKYHYVQRPDSI